MNEPFVHETAIVEDGATVGAGCRIWHFTHVMSGASLGRDVGLGQNVFVADGVTIGDGCRVQNNVSLFRGLTLEDGVFVGPSAVFTNVRRPRARFPKKPDYEITHVGEGATIGANATVICGIRIGRCAFVAAGAVVARDVPAFALIGGCPAGVLGWTCRCGESLGGGADVPEEASCASCGRRYRADGDALTEVEDAS